MLSRWGREGAFAVQPLPKGTTKAHIYPVLFTTDRLSGTALLGTVTASLGTVTGDFELQSDLGLLLVVGGFLCLWWGVL